MPKSHNLVRFGIMDNSWAGHPHFGKIPVIVTSIFEDLPHLRRAYRLLARAYWLKPIHLESLRDALSALNDGI